MIATRFRSVYWVGGVAVAALGCYLVSQRVAAERATLAHVESDIIAGKRAIRALQTEIGTRAGLNQIERWNAEVISLTAPKPAQYLANEIQLASLVQPVRPAMEAPAVVQAAAVVAPAERAPQITRASYEPAPVVATEEPRPAAKPGRKAEAKSEHRAEPKPERIVEAKPEHKAAAKPERSAEAKPERKAQAKPERSAEAKPAHKAEAKIEPKVVKVAREEKKADEKKARTERKRAEPAVRFVKADGDDAPRVRNAVYVKPGRDHQNVALLDDKLLGSITRIAARERSGGKRDR